MVHGCPFSSEALRLDELIAGTPRLASKGAWSCWTACPPAWLRGLLLETETIAPARAAGAIRGKKPPSKQGAGSNTALLRLAGGVI